MPKWITSVFSAHDGDEEYEMWAIIPDDLTDGFIIGEWDDVLNLHKTLKTSHRRYSPVARARFAVGNIRRIIQP